MFYRLTHLDGVALPAIGAIGSYPYTIVAGGLLVEPGVHANGEGHAILNLFESPAPGTSAPRFVGSSAEPCRWLATDRMEISRSSIPESERPRHTRFVGERRGEQLVLTYDSAADFLTYGTILGFVASPDEPIPEAWQDTFYQVGGWRHVGPPISDEELRAWQASHEARRRVEAEARLARAWKAPP